MVRGQEEMRTIQEAGVQLELLVQNNATENTPCSHTSKNGIGDLGLGEKMNNFGTVPRTGHMAVGVMEGEGRRQTVCAGRCGLSCDGGCQPK